MTLEKEIVSLGIESTAHTFGIGIATSKGKILANVRKIYRPLKGGIHPREAAEFFSQVAVEVLDKAFKKASINPSEIDVIAVALGPGLGPCLRIGATVARTLSLELSKPLVPVNHGVAHIEIGRILTGLTDPLVVYISGGNTLIATYVEGRYRILGETLDIALGNCLDTFARETGLGFPGGPILDKIYERRGEFIELPYTVKGMNLSFAGILTAALRLVNNGYKLENVAYSLVETTYSMIAEVTERALVLTKKNEILLVGGVAASKPLREKLETVARIHKVIFKPVPLEYSGDNGAMIAITGALAYLHGISIDIEKSYILPKWRIDEVDVPWFYYLNKILPLKVQKYRKRKKEAIMGAEAIISETSWFNIPAIKKKRIPKKYRSPLLDKKIRQKRTIREAKILYYAAKLDVPVPALFDVDPE
ncbi:MAG TPA: bifunctional N(6)-L-threonylcarbamoyladenine synthase/serine/threonine protein kinase, partial [Thermoproteales archaeon]|nr:bifunctional N(6)-L-threonylcarbamoyladenine synthase/serine/threonine protein kinase [Thermoproteales archaeon]